MCAPLKKGFPIFIFRRTIMSSSMDFFRKLGTGAKFDLKRFRGDAERFQIIKPSLPSAPDDISKTLDIFGTSVTKATNVRHEQVQQKQLSVQIAVKRKMNNCGQRERSTRNRKKRKTTDSGNSTSESSDSDDDTPSSSPTPDHHRRNRTVANDEDSDDKDSSDETDNDKDMEQSEVTLMSSSNGKAKTTSADDKEKCLEEEAMARQQSVKSFRRQHRIHVLGTDVPDPLGAFHEMQREYRLHTNIVENIHKAGYVTPTPIQMQAIPLMIHRRELLACAPTGSGKTAAFILPVLHHLKEPRRQGFRAVVVSPSRELAQQTYREFERLGEGRGFRVHMIDNTAKAAKKFGPQSAGKFDILVTTPNRLVYMLNQDPPTIKLNNVEWLIVDESDKLFEGGKRGFREQLATIYQACDSNQVRRAMFSATFTFEVEQWCKLNLDNVVIVTVGQRNAATDTVKQELMFVGDEYGKLLAIRDLFKKGFLPPVLIFVQSKDRAKELFHELIYDGYNVDVIHADKSQVQRDNVVRCFRGGKIWVLIATELMGRGIDFKGVNIVINYDFPLSAISYIHRIGRTGRAGREGSAITLFTEDDIPQLRSIANVMRNAGCKVPEYMLQLKKKSKTGKKKQEQRPIQRKTIRTLPTPVLEKAKLKKSFAKNKFHPKDQLSNNSANTKSVQHSRKWTPKNKQAKKEKQEVKWSKVEGSEMLATSNADEFTPRTKKAKKRGKKFVNNKNGKDKKSRIIKKKSGVKQAPGKTNQKMNKMAKV